MAAECFIEKRSRQELSFLIETHGRGGRSHNPGMAKRRHYLKEWRKSRDLTQEQASSVLGISRSHLANLERGERDPDLAILEAMSKVYRCSVPELIVRNPADPASLWTLFEAIEEQDRAQAAKVLEAFKKSA
mgnify:CR=1 FL=1